MARHRNYQLYLALLALLCFLAFPAFAAGANPGPQPIFVMQDPVGDEKGPGTYVYPQSPVFGPGKGLFDLTKFEILADGDNYYFRLTMGAMNNPWGAPEGFSHQRIAIYIDSVPNQGRTETLREGAFVDFDPGHGWEYLVDILGWNNSRVYYFTDEKSSKGRTGVEVKLISGTNTIQAKVPRKLLDDYPNTWALYVLVGAQDGLGPDNFRQVLEKPTEWQFGGGSDTYYDPNVLDLLDPGGSEHSQKSMLASYNIVKGKLAVLVPVVLTEVPQDLPEGPSWWETSLVAVTAPFKVLWVTFPWKYYYPVYIAGGVAVILVILLIVVNWYRYTHPE